MPLREASLETKHVRVLKQHPQLEDFKTVSDAVQQCAGISCRVTCGLAWQGIQAVYTPFAALLQGVKPLLANRVDDAIAAAFQSVAPYSPFIDGAETVLPYSFVTVIQRGEIQNAAYALASILRQVGMLTHNHPSID